MEQVVTLLVMGGIVALAAWVFLKRIPAEEARRDAEWEANRAKRDAERAEWARAYDEAMIALNTLTTCDTDVLGCCRSRVEDAPHAPS